MELSQDFKNMLLNENINPEDVLEFTTENNKKSRKNITTIILIDGTKRTLIRDFVYFAARKNKRW